MNCHEKSGCEHPEKKRHAEDCTPGQIQECHSVAPAAGDVQAHPCECTPERIQECHGQVQQHPCEHSQ